MARSGRRFKIGAAGPLSRDETLGQGGDPNARGEFTRGEVRPYQPPTPEAVPETPPAAPPAEAPAGEIVVVVPDNSRPSGDPGSDTGAPPGGPPDGPPSDSGPPSDATSARGRKVTGSEGEHPITAQKGEWIIQESAVKKYGDAFMKAVNAGKIKIMKRSEAAQHFGKGGKVDVPISRSGRAYARMK